MKFQVTKTSLGNMRRKPTNDQRAYKEGDYWYIDLNTLDEVIQFVTQEKKQAVITTAGNIPVIEIYNSHRE